MQKKCPVLSNDSDFYIFSVDFIRLDSVDINRTIEEGHLVAMRFNREKLLRYYGLKSDGKLSKGYILIIVLLGAIPRFALLGAQITPTS